MSYSPMSYRTRTPNPERTFHGVISETPSRMPQILSFLLTAALFLGAFLATFAHAFAA